MGVFVNIIKSNEAYIPTDKTEEFTKRIEKLFQASGMMDWDRICITDEMEIMDEDEVPWYYCFQRRKDLIRQERPFGDTWHWWQIRSLEIRFLDFKEDAYMLRPTAVEVKSMPNYRLWIRFDNNEQCILDVSPYIKGEWYGRLADESYFSTVKADGYTISWPDGQDLCPDEVYYMSKSIVFNE